MSRRAYGLVTEAACDKAATRHARLILLAASKAATDSSDAVQRADMRTSMADAHAALAALRGQEQ